MGQGGGEEVGEAPGGLKRMGLREEVRRGQEPGRQWKEFVPNCTHCLSAPDSLYGWLMGKEGWWAWGERVRTGALS